MINQDIQQAFNKAAHTYANASFLYQAIGERLLSRLDYMRCEPQVILDAGCALGHGAKLLSERYPQAEVIALDFATNMIQEGKKIHPASGINWVVGNMENLPLLPESVDLIFANQCVQDIDDINALFQLFYRVLKPGGVLLFSTLGPDTLKECKAAWACVDTYGHMHELKDLHIYGDALLSQQFMQPVVDREEMTVHYKEPAALLKDLKEQGGYNIHPLRRKGLMGVDARDYLYQMLDTQKQEGKIALTYEVVYGHAWRGESLSRYNAKTGETSITLDQLRIKSKR